MRGRVHLKDSHVVLLDSECGIGGGCPGSYGGECAVPSPHGEGGVRGSRAGPTHTLTALSRGFAPDVLCHMRLKQV